MNKRVVIGFFLLLAQCLYTRPSFAQAGITTKVDAQQITIGDQVRYFISTQVDTSNAQLRWASFPDTFNTLEIVEKGKIDTQRNGAILSLKQRLLITGFDSGSFLIPRFTFTSISKSGTVDTFFSDSLRIAVNTVAVDTSKAFKDIHNIAEVQTSWQDYLPQIIGSIIGLAILIGLILYFIKKRKEKKNIPTPAYTESFHQQALRLLAELDAKELWQQGKPKEYYTELSHIIREYIEARFHTNAMELTTDELLRLAKTHKEMHSYRASLKPLLRAADLAKFAKANPTPDEHIEALKLAQRFIQVSKPKPIVNPQNPQQ